jgi:hypothetical protein
LPCTAAGTIGRDDLTRAKTRFSRSLNFRVFQHYPRVSGRSLGFRRKRRFLARLPNGRHRSDARSLRSGAPTVPLDTSTPLDNYPSKPCGGGHGSRRVGSRSRARPIRDQFPRQQDRREPAAAADGQRPQGHRRLRSGRPATAPRCDCRIGWRKASCGRHRSRVRASAAEGSRCLSRTPAQSR